MLSRSLLGRAFNQVRNSRAAQAMPYNFSRAAFSSEEAAKPDDDKKVPEPTKEEIEAGRAEWGIKYDDECLKFEKEWQEIASRVEQE